ncbi:MAG TPA: OB-fold domain-containing protein [Acidimicrobiales bacterium]
MTAAAGDWLVADELAPDPNGALAPLFERAAVGELVMPFCDHCSQPLELEQFACDACGGQAAWRRVDPSGTVHAVTTVHRREPGLIRAPDPYPVIDVELDSGHRVITTTTTPVAEQPHIGQPVALSFRIIGDVAVPAVAAPEPSHHNPEVEP